MGFRGLPTCVFASMQAAMPLGGCFRGMEACMLANAHVGSPQEPMERQCQWATNLLQQLLTYNYRHKSVASQI